MKIKSMYIEKFRRFSDISFSLGKRITVISGQNGIGKSTILSLISSVTGTSDKRMEKGTFQPQFTDFFKIDESENYKDYRVYVDFDKKLHNDKKGLDYNLTKKISFNNYSESGRSIRVIPRSVPPFIKTEPYITVKDAKADTYQQTGVKESARIQLPTLYLSLSRLLPIVESETITELFSNRTKIQKTGYYEKFRDYFNAVFPDSISKNTQSIGKLKKNATNKVRLSMEIDRTTAKTISVGQDNLSNIISALVNFDFLKKELGDSYPGGVLCVDEVDASLHPSAIIRLIELLKQLSEELNLQIILTSHSLTVLKQIIHLQKNDAENFQLVYFMDYNLPRISRVNSYSMLKAELFDQISFKRPIVKIYGEDQSSILLYKSLTTAAENLNLLSRKNLRETKEIDIKLGKENLKSIISQDEYFKSVLIILDGDSRLKYGIDNDQALHSEEFSRGKTTTNPKNMNMVFLPGYLPPESFLFQIIKDYVDNPEKHQSFWKAMDVNKDTALYTTSRVKNILSLKEDTCFTDIHKKEYEHKLFKFVNNTDILTDYYSTEEHNGELLEFVSHFKKGFNFVSSKLAGQKI